MNNIESDPIINTDELSFESTNYGSAKEASIIKVVGVGGAGGNAVQRMYEDGIVGVDYFLCNTDKQALQRNKVATKLKLGKSGLGAGTNPQIAKEFAEESVEEIRQLIGEETKMLFITAGMGKGTGTGASPVIARIAHEMGILTVGVVTYPFDLEMKKCREKADEGIAELRQYVDSLIVIKNQRVLQANMEASLPDALAAADGVVKNAVKCIAELINITGYQNVDFSDVEAALRNGGEAMLGMAEAEGENRIEEVVSKALTYELIDDEHITNAQNFLFFVSYDSEHPLTVAELFKLDEEFSKYKNENSVVNFGHTAEEGLGDKIKLSVIITKFSGNALKMNNINNGSPVVMPEPTIVIPATLPLETPVVATAPDFTSAADPMASAPIAAAVVAPVVEAPVAPAAPVVETPIVSAAPAVEAPVAPAISAVPAAEPIANTPAPAPISAPTTTSPTASLANPLSNDPFFQQSNVPEPANAPQNIILEAKPAAQPTYMPTATAPKAVAQRVNAPTAGISVIDNGISDYDDDVKFAQLVNEPAYRNSLQEQRYIDVQTPAMQRTVQPAYETSKAVFFGLDATMAD